MTGIGIKTTINIYFFPFAFFKQRLSNRIINSKSQKEAFITLQIAKPKKLVHLPFPRFLFLGYPWSTSSKTEQCKSGTSGNSSSRSKWEIIFLSE